MIATLRERSTLPVGAGPRRSALDPDTAREQAREILSESPFRREPPPRPLRGVLEWFGDLFLGIGRWFRDGPIGDVVAAVGRALGSVLEPVGRALAPLPGPTWLLPGAALIALAVLLLARTTSRAGSPWFGAGSRRSSSPAAPDDPAALERAAVEAERRGDLDEALRLRFRAGLLRLDERGAITFRPSLTTGEVRRLLGSDTFDELATTFEEVTYGGRPAGPPDVATAREAWPRLLREAKR